MLVDHAQLVENEHKKNEVYDINDLMGHPCNYGEVASVWHTFSTHTMLFVIPLFMISYKIISSRSGGLGMTNSRFISMSCCCM
jgi:hypothetical protein